MKSTKQITKLVTILAIFKFKHVARICFIVKSSQSDAKYHTCFQGDGRESCNCPSKGGCYHRDQLRERAQAYFESRKQEHTTPAASLAHYDVVGASLQIVNQAQADAKIGDCYDVLATMKRVSQPVFGTCGHLAKRADRSCGCDA